MFNYSSSPRVPLGLQRANRSRLEAPFYVIEGCVVSVTQLLVNLAGMIAKPPFTFRNRPELKLRSWSHCEPTKSGTLRHVF